MLALGSLGLHRYEEAEKYLCEVEQLEGNHLGILALRTFINLSLMP